MDSLNRSIEGNILHKKLCSHIYNYAEDSVVLKVTKSHNSIVNNEDGDGVKHGDAPHSLCGKATFRTTFFKSDQERKQLRLHRKTTSVVLPSIPTKPKTEEDDKISVQSSSRRSTISRMSSAESDAPNVSWESVLPVSMWPTKTKSAESLYDDTRPIDPDVINHMVRLRSALGWRTMLPRHGPGVRHAMKISNHKNPLKEMVILKEDPGEYVYAVLKKQKTSLVNPFALRAVSANTARTRDVFYTITATSVTKWVRQGEIFDSEVTPVIWWLYEQRLFNMICDFTLFTRFRPWKQFQVWKLVVRAGKVTVAKHVVFRSLFSIDTRLQDCILRVRSICEDISGSRDGIGVGENAISLLKCDARKTYDLDEFAAEQRLTLKCAIQNLKKFRSHVISLAEGVCSDYAATNGINSLVRRGKVCCKQFLSHSAADITDTTYTQLAVWRKVLSRLSAFISLLDYMIHEMINRLVVTATDFFLSFLVVSNRDGKCSVSSENLSIRCFEKTDLYNDVTNNSEECGYKTLKDTSRSKISLKPSDTSLEEILIPVQKEPKKQEDKFSPPLFRVRVVLEVTASEADSAGSFVSNISNKTPASQSARRASVVRFGKNVSFSAQSRDSIDSSFIEDDESEMTSRRQSIISEQSGTGEPTSHVVLSPSKSEFNSTIGKIVEGFKQAISEIEPIRTADELKDFTHAPAFDIQFQWTDLTPPEEGDEDEIGDVKGRNKLSVKDEGYKMLVKEVFDNLDEAMREATEYSSNYVKYCGMVDESKAMDVDDARKQQEWSPEEFAAVLYKFTEMTKEIRDMKASKRIAMFQVDARGFGKSSLPYPQTVVDAVHCWLPLVTTRHNEELLTVVRRATRKLDCEPDTVEMFVEHLTFLGRTTTEMPALDNEYLTVTRFFKIIKDYGVWLDPEQLAIFQTLVPAFQHLKTTLLFCEAKKDENISKFSTDLDGHIHNLRYQLFDVRNKVISPHLLSSESLSVAALESIKLLADEVEDLVVKARSYANYQDRFGSSYSANNSKKIYTVEALIAAESAENKVSAAQLQAEISEVERDITLRKLLWESNEEWARLEQEWKDTRFLQLNTDTLQENVGRFMQTVFMLEKGLPRNDILPRLKEAVLNFKQNMPLIAALRNTCLKPRHWEEIQYAIGRSLTRDASLTLGELLKWRLVQHRDLVMEISTRATNEATLLAMLNKLMQQWHESDFKLVSHTSASQTVMIISTADEIWSQLEESQITIATIKGSRYVAPIKVQVEDWERRLMLFARTLDEWMKCQRNWLYLEPVFTTADIQRQLAQESQLFSQVNQIWRDLMRRTEDRPNALRAGTGAGVLESLQACNSNLEKIQKSLEDYLDIKRLAFPRFYFLSNDELLSVLSRGKDPSNVQSHLAKCFANIRYLDIRHSGSKQPTICSMISAEGEVVKLLTNVKVRGSVEQWLSTVESAMYDTIRKHLKMALMSWSTLPENLPTWIFQHPGQVALTVAQIMFNKDVSNAFASGMPDNELMKIHKDFMEALNVLSETVSNQQIVTHQYFTLEAMIIIYVHIRDIINGLITSEITNRDDFEWNRQLLYEWQDMTNMCRVVQADARFAYGCEYIGCASRLVVTPLTDRCFLTLTGALNLHLGGSPAGPAGTGKSETVKDLAKILGKQCVVFNCSEGIDFKMTAQFFSGLSQSGSWCCFDEFNRIDVEVLSVIASQVHLIKAAKDAQALRFQFDGKEIRLNPSCAYFITMNPGYRGRVELPDNLKSLFRPVAMMVPDYALITEIILFSEGFREAKLFSRKVVNLYELASKQLSQQDHYDFGMRAIKSVLVMAGQKKREILTNQRTMSPQGIREQERSILIHSLKNANLPRFLAEDAPLFHSIMSDLFPGVTSSPIGSSMLKKCVKQSLVEMNLEKWPDQIQKVIQLNEQLAVRHGVMLVGPSGGGKTTVRTVLQRALTAYYHTMALGEERIGRRKKFVETFSINPKCVTLGELYGFTDPNTLEWADGLLAYIVRKFAKELSSSDFQGARRPKTSVSFQDSQGSRDTPSSLKSESSSLKTARSDDATDFDWRWIILDGPVDTAWVENLNTALDDTKTLCLANGERIHLPDNLRLVFEVDSLSKASPATISRCAMVYMDPVELGWKPFVKSWMGNLPKAFPESGREHLWNLFELSTDAGLQLLDRRVKFQHLPVPHLCIVQSLCRILHAIFAFMENNGGYGEPDQKDDGEAGRAGKSASRSRSSERHTSSLVELAKSGLNTTPGKWYLETHPDKLCQLIGKLFVFAYTWSFGGVLNREDDQEDDTLISSSVIGRDETLINMSYDFDHFVHDLFEKDPIVNVTFPSGSRSVFSYFIDLQTGRFTPWDNLVPLTRTLIERGLTYTLVGSNKAMLSDRRKSAATDSMATLVPTTDTIRYSFLTALLLLSKYPVLLTGDSGVGKTALLQNILNKLCEVGGTGADSGTILGDVFRAAEKTSAIIQSIASLGLLGQSDDSQGESLSEDAKTSHAAMLSKHKTGSLLVNMIQFSALTQPHQCQTQILNKLVKRSRDIVGPPRGKKCIAFVNDLNMPVCDEHGAQPPLELIRQFLDMNGFYDIKNLTWKSVSDVTLAATAAPPGGGRSVISQRTLKYFSVFALPQPSTRSLQHIYQVQLGHFVENRDFMPEVKECCSQVVNAAIAVYYKMCNAMLPTPNKSHYTFNLRDLSAVIKGVLQADESVIVSRETIAQLFAHEATRIFHDRLTDDEDRKLFYEFLSDDLHNYFKITISSESLWSNPFIFGDFTDLNAPSSTRTYRQLPGYEVLSTMLEEYYMRTSGSSVNTAHLVFFEAAINHVIRAARAFRQPGTHMLLVGIDGTGKSTTCKLAARIAGCQLYRLSIVRGYTITDFREELKKIHRQCGVVNQPTVFLLTDADLVSDAFLEDINCMLNTGEDAELFDSDELDAIVMDIKQVAIANDVQDSRAAMLDFFRRRVNTNLHIAIATSPAGGTFRHRCRTHPALINCCTIDWYDRWPEEALTSVACSYFSKDNADTIRMNNASNLDTNANAEASVDADKVSALCVRIHFSATAAGERLWEEMRRRYYTTPTTYLEFIQLFTKMLEDNKENFNKDLARLHTGLHKLAEAKSLVNVMQEELVGLGPKIEQKARDTDRLMIQLRKDTEAVNEVREIVRQEEATMRTETQLVQDFAHQAAMDLQSVLPALQEAVVSLDSLDKSDIAELRVYNNPPQMVLTVMNAVCILLQAKEDWPSAKQLLTDPLFLKKLILLDRDAIPTRVFNKLRKLTRNPEFNVDRVGEVSAACKSICMWVLALQHYNDVKRMVEPKQRRVQEAREALEVAQENLKNKQASLNKIQHHLTQLKLKFEESVTQQETFKERKITTGKRLRRAAMLINALADEEGRWKESVEKLKKKLGGLIGDTLVSSASVAYLGPFIRSYRDEMTAEWLSFCDVCGVHTSTNYNLIKMMRDGNQIRTWHNQGLPRDVHSTVNAVVIHAARRWPLIVDPQGQATNWIKQMEKSNLRVVFASDSNYMKSVENAIRVGEALLLCDVEESLDPELRPVLQKEMTHRSGQDYITIGGTEITYNHSFRLYMTTSRANPHFLPAVCIAVTIVNFGITFEGLQGQLLSNVVTHERPHLEAQRGELLNNIATDLRLLQELEDKALMLLENQQGHILDDEDLISTLKQSKMTSAEVLNRLQLSEENEAKTEAARGRYLPVATRGAVLYFVLADLEILNSMYQFSLQWFTDMFLKCVEQAHSDVTAPQPSSISKKVSDEPGIVEQSEEEDRDDHLEMILQRMINVLTHGVYKVVSYSLFNQHQIIFSFLLATAIMRNNERYHDKWKDLGALSDHQWNVFLHTRALTGMTDVETLEQHSGESAMEKQEAQAGIHSPRPSSLGWINRDTWRQCQYISWKISSFQGLCRSLLEESEMWKEFCQHPDPYHLMETKFQEENSDHEFNWTNFTKFERILLIKVLRPECLLPSVRWLVHDLMGAEFVQHDGFNLKQIYSISQSTVPLIFILSPGTDPSAQLLRYAKEVRGSSLHVDMVSLGRGQGPKAEDLIHKAQILKGRWVFLQNCHLAASFMPRLQTIVEELNSPGSDIDSEFRLWLSSKPDPSFPVPILQNGLKMAVEPPRGIRAHLQLAFGASGSGEVTSELYEYGSSHSAWKPLLFSLCCFNALAHERRKFGTLGFNLPYDFTSSDLEVSILMLKQLLEGAGKVPWSALLHLTGEVVYGGRVTDDWDRRCLVSTLSKFYCNEALEPDNTFSRDGVFRPPDVKSKFTQIRDYINGLPLSDPPDVFGMHDNAERAHMESEANRLVDVIIQVQPKLATASVLETGKTDAEIVSELTKDMLHRLPSSVERDEQQGESERDDQLTLSRLLTNQVWKNLLNKAEKQNEDNEDRLPILQSALLTVARQEIDRFNKLLEIVQTSLKALNRAIDGEIIMSESLDRTYEALLSQKVPESWQSVSYESCKLLGSWLEDLLQRIDFFAKWSKLVVTSVQAKVGFTHRREPSKKADLQSDVKHQEEPTSYWLSAFFFPQGFLTGVLQNYARKHKVPVDALTFQFEVQNSFPREYEEEDKISKVNKVAFRQSDSPLEDGVRIFGLYLDSARWNLERGVLVDSLSTIRFCEMPEIHFIPTQNLSAVQENVLCYECPLYRTSVRAGTLSSTGHSTNFVSTVALRSDQPSEYWTLQGTALLSQLDN